MKGIKIFIFCFLILLFQSCQVFADDVQEKVNGLVAAFIKENNIPGAAVALHYKGKDYFVNVGYANLEQQTPVTSDTIFEIASITKVFTSTTLALAVTENKLKLNDPIYHYLPGIAETHGLPIDEVTTLQLATHTASFPRNIQGFGVARGDEAGLMEKLKTWQPPYPIGSKFRYSNISFGLLGTVVTNATHTAYYPLLVQSILAPLQMQNTYVIVPQDKMAKQAQGYNRENQPVPYFIPTKILGGGELRSSAADLLNFMKANLNLSVGQGNATLLSAMQFAQKPYFKVNPNFSMGLGWQLIYRNNEPYVTKNGANHGFNSFMAFSPENKMGVVVLVNKVATRPGRLGFAILETLK